MLLKKWACDLPWDFLHCVFWRTKALNGEGQHVSVFSSVICAFCVKGFLPFFFFPQVLVLALSLSSMIQSEFILKYAWSKDWYLSIYQQSSHPSISLLVYWNEGMHAKSTSLLSDSAQLCGLQPVRLLCPWDFPGKNTGVVAMPSFRGSARPRDRTQVSYGSCIGKQVVYH